MGAERRGGERTHTISGTALAAVSLMLLGLSVTSLVAWVVLRTRLIASISSSALPDVSPSGSSDARACVVVVVPMRNEVKNARACVLSLLDQRDVVQIVAVDDGSTDGTYEALAQLAATEERVHLIRVERKPEGWAGKSYACYVGSQATREVEWLLFVDADTRLSPGALDKAIVRAEERRLDALSLFGALRCPGAWDKLATPFYFGLLGALVPTRSVNDPQRGDAYFVGSFILIRRSRYFEMGGHAAVSSDLVEDRALGKLAKRRGLRIELESAPDEVSAEWAPGFRNSVDALLRVTVPPMRGRVRVGVLIALALTLLFTVPLLAVAVAGLELASHGTTTAEGAALLSVGTAALLAEFAFTSVSTARFHLSRFPFALGFLPASLVYATVLWWSVSRALRMKSVRWRDRVYEPTRTQP